MFVRESLQGCIQGYGRVSPPFQEAVRANPVNAVPFSDEDETTAKSEAERENLKKENILMPWKRSSPALDDHRRRRIISDALTNKCCHFENWRERVKKLRMA
jgi:hypothetical protein